MPIRIPVVGPGGKRGTIPAENVDAAEKKGFRLATGEEARAMQAGGQNVEALAEGAARGYTAGLSDLDSSPDVKLRKDENPILSTVGEVGGTIAGLVGPGPIAGIAKLGQATKVAAGGKLLGTAAGGLVEGGLFGLGSVVSEEGLGDHQTNVEKLAAMGGGGLFGATLGLATHGLGAAGSALISKLGGKTLNGALEDLAEKALWGQISSQKIMRRRGLLGQESEVARYALDNGMVPGLGSAEAFGQNVESHRKVLGDKMGEILQKASSREVMGLEGKPVTQTISGGFDPHSLVRRVEDGMLAKLRKDPGSESSVNYIEKYMGKMVEGRHTLAEAHELQSTLNKKIPATDVGLRADVKDFGRLFREEIYDQASAVSPHYGEQLRDLSTKYSKTKALQDLSNEQAIRSSGNSPIGIGGMIAGASAYASGGLLGGVGGAIAAKAAKERGGFILAAAADKLASSSTLDGLAKSLKTTIEKIGESGGLGRYRLLLENAGAKGAANLLATHVQLAKSDPMYLPTLGLQNETPDAANQYASKAERLGAVQAKIAEHDARTDTLAGRFLGQVPGRATTTKIEPASRKRYDEVLAKINAVLRSPGGVDADLASTAPNLAMNASVHAQSTAQFLLDKAPKNPGVQGLKAFSMPWSPSQAELARFNRYVRVVENPQVVLEDLKSKGHVDVEASEVMRTVYPKLLADMQEKMMQRLMEYKKPLSYKEKLSLDSLFGSEFRGGNPKHLALLQQLQADSMGQSEGGGQSDGRQSHSQEDNLKTQAQKTESR